MDKCSLIVGPGPCPSLCHPWDLARLLPGISVQWIFVYFLNACLSLGSLKHRSKSYGEGLLGGKQLNENLLSYPFWSKFFGLCFHMCRIYKNLSQKNLILLHLSLSPSPLQSLLLSTNVVVVVVMLKMMKRSNCSNQKYILLYCQKCSLFWKPLIWAHQERPCGRLKEPVSKAGGQALTLRVWLTIGDLALPWPKVMGHVWQ